MLSIILIFTIVMSSFTLFLWTALGVNFICALTMNLPHDLETLALAACIIFISLGFSLMYANLLKTIVAAIKDWQKRKDEVTEVEAIVTKRALKFTFYKVTVAYEDLTVTLEDYTLYNICREGETIRMNLRTRNRKGTISRTLSID